MTRTLIVGAGSPLGRAIVSRFSDDGHTVVGVSRSGAEGAESVDITDPDAAFQLLQRARPEIVVNLARPALPEDAAAAATAVDESVAALTTFATQCRQAGVERLLFASSAAVYGTDSTRPVAEIDATPALGPYARLKLLSERAISDVATDTGLGAVALRIFNVYGPGFPNSLVTRLLASAADGSRPTVFATDHFVRDYVHADDVAAVFAAAAVSPGLPSGALNVGTGVGTGNLELLAMIPDAEWIPGGDLATPSVSIADVTRLRELLGAVPPARLADTLKER